MAGSRRTAAPLARRTQEEYELILPQPNRRRERLYPPWWRRLTSLVILGGMTLLVGVVVGTAIGALLAFLYRIVQSSL